MRKLSLVLLLTIGFLSSRAELVITELMQSNIDCVLDDTNDFPDSWVELYNPSDVAINLSDYSLGLTDVFQEAAALPDVECPPKGFVVVYCDKKTGGLHLPFRLESGKNGSIFLFKGVEIITSAKGLPKMISPNVSLGLNERGQWVWQVKATPGEANDKTEFKGILSAPVFSHPGAVNPSDFTLDISVMPGSPSESVVRYTLDGSLPTANSPIWKNPVDISSTTIIRASTFCDGYVSPFPATQSYIFLGRDMNLTVVSLNTDYSYFYGEELGILLGGDIYPGVTNYKNEWRRPINIEVFDNSDSPSVINQLGETRVKGGGSRGYELKSLVMYANSRFGTKQFNYEFFPDDAPQLTDWKSFELRNSGNDFYSLYFRDALIQYSVGKYVDLDFQYYRPAIVMFNGEYKGILNIRSRTNEDLIYTKYAGLEDINLIENWNEIKAGSKEEFEDFVKFYSEESHTFDEFSEKMDLEEYTNFMLMNLLYDNKDFPGNNFVMWRPRQEDGRWRFIAKDTDFGLGIFEDEPEFKTLDWLYTPDYDDHYNWANKKSHTQLFRTLMDIPAYREMFTERAAVYLGDFLRPEMVCQRLNAMYEHISPEYIYHHNAAYYYYDWKPWAPARLPLVQSWYERRVPFFYQHLAEFYNLGTPVRVQVKESDEISQLSINGINLISSDFDGYFFSGHQFVLNGVSDSGDDVEAWTYEIGQENGEVIKGTSNGRLELLIPEDAMFVHISPGENVWDSAIPEGSYEKVFTVYDMSGRYYGKFSSISDAERSLSKGIYIFCQGEKSFKRCVQ